MKTIISRNKLTYTFRYTTPGGVHNIPFHNGKATVTDELADNIVHLYGSSGMYAYATVEDQSLEIPGNSVLLIRDMGMGDLLMITPLIRALAKRGLHVDVKCREDYQALFENNPYVRQTYALDNWCPKDYSCVMDLRQIVEKAEAIGALDHRIIAFAKHMDVYLSPEDAVTDYFPRLSEVAEWDKYAAMGKLIIGFAWSASVPVRSWSEARNIEMLKALSATGLYTVLVFSERGLMIPILDGVYNLGGSTTIRQTGAAVSICDAVVTPDTGIFHLAGALDIPTIAYFSTHPIGERQAHKSLTILQGKGCPLFPCRQYGCPNTARIDVSPCIDIAPEQLLKLIALTLGKKGK